MGKRKSVRVHAGDALQFAEDYKLECKEKLHRIDLAVAAQVFEAEGKFKPSLFARLFRTKGLVFDRERAQRIAESDHQFERYWLDVYINDMTSLRYEALYYLKEGFSFEVSTQGVEIDSDYADRFFRSMAKNNIS